jgi:hypothetical protein
MYLNILAGSLLPGRWLVNSCRFCCLSLFIFGDLRYSKAVIISLCRCWMVKRVMPSYFHATSFALGKRAVSMMRARCSPCPCSCSISLSVSCCAMNTLTYLISRDSGLQSTQFETDGRPSSSYGLGPMPLIPYHLIARYSQLLNIHHLLDSVL